MSVLAALLESKFVILFYIAIFLLIYLNRKKFEVQAKVIALYRTKLGLGFMERFAKRFKKPVRGFGYASIVVGFIGLIVIIYFLVKGLIDLLLVPNHLPVVAPVIPGIPIAGIYLPFWIGIISIFIVIVVHEFSHGIVAIAHNLKLKSSGFGMFAIFPIAFVEPDEEALRKKTAVAQYSILGAGPFANVVLAAVAFVLLMVVIAPAANSMANPVGVSFETVQSELPGEEAGLQRGMIITAVGNETVSGLEGFIQIMSDKTPNETIVITANDSNYNVVLAQNPDDPNKGYIGITGLKNEISVKPGYGILYPVVNWIGSLFLWLFIISFGIGLINLFPIYITDGARMLQVLSFKIKNKEKANKIFAYINNFCVLVLILNLLIPFVRWLGSFVA